MKRTFGALAVLAGLAGMAPAAFAQADARMGDIIVVGFNFCPRGYSETNNQIQAIQQNPAMFSLLGTMYGGNGQTTYALPEMRGRVPVSQGEGPGLPFYDQGSLFGSNSVTLTVLNMPQHNHRAFGTSSAPNEETPAGHSLASFPAPLRAYSSGPASVTMAAQTIGITGGSQPIQINAPTTTLRTCIAMQGVYPSRS
jgi:microcystin-dependent protein